MRPFEYVRPRVAENTLVGTNPGGTAVASPLDFIATNRLKAGQLERERERVQGLVEFIEASEPRLIAFNEYVSEDGDEVTVVQVHPDTASLEAHMKIVRERAQEAYAETLDATVRIQAFGRPTAAILEAHREQAGNGVELSVSGEHLAGFIRSAMGGR
jgi:hypothetical protein